MLTIKVFQPDGSQFVREAESVLETVELDGRHVVKYWSKDVDLPATIQEGVIYVMNDNGKTVANYRLYPREDTESAPPQPIES